MVPSEGDKSELEDVCVIGTQLVSWAHPGQVVEGLMHLIEVTLPDKSSTSNQLILPGLDVDNQSLMVPPPQRIAHWPNAPVLNCVQSDLTAFSLTL